MRLWLNVLMVAVLLALSPLLRTSFRISVGSNLQRVAPAQASQVLHRLGFKPFTTSEQEDQTDTMAESIPSAPNPMPILSAAGPLDPKVVTDALPKLSAADFQVYNRLAIMMDAYHNHFRHTWNMLQKSCTTNKRPMGMSIRAFINTGLQFCQQLTFHHTIEEQHIFPELAERMPIFKDDELLIKQHEMIHEGIEKTEHYLDQCRSGERELRMDELCEILDSYGKVLWDHLDEEVRTLGAENMRKYWSKDEIRGMNW